MTRAESSRPAGSETPVNQLLAKLPDLFAPEICLEDDGEIGFDWDQGSDCVLSISLRESDGRVSWATSVDDFKASGHFFLPDWPDDLRAALVRYGHAETDRVVNAARSLALTRERAEARLTDEAIRAVLNSWESESIDGFRTNILAALFPQDGSR